MDSSEEDNYQEELTEQPKKRGRPVGVGDQPGALGVAPYCVGAGVLQPHSGPGLG